MRMRSAGFGHDKLVATDPTVGERKKGDLADLFVYKFRSMNQLV